MTSGRESWLSESWRAEASDAGSRVAAWSAFSQTGFADQAPICGVDEAGRGPLAGPVAAAAVILPSGFPLGLLDDSKALSPKARDRAYAAIVEGAHWANEWAWPSEIDELNILGATMLAMRRAFLRLISDSRTRSPAFGASGLSTGGTARGDGAPGFDGAWRGLVIVDGNRIPDVPARCVAMVAADAKVPAVMAASIVAKVSRDRLMERYDWLYPDYGYARHKGYPTKDHRAACRSLGPSPIQRNGFDYSKP